MAHTLLAFLSALEYFLLNFKIIKILVCLKILRYEVGFKHLKIFFTWKIIAKVFWTAMINAFAILAHLLIISTAKCTLLKRKRNEY